jgi:hypothetical protein
MAVSHEGLSSMALVIHNGDSDYKLNRILKFGALNEMPQ